ncbi:uncharacterized protein LOC144129741 [Amblyomma americanum]
MRSFVLTMVGLWTLSLSARHVWSRERHGSANAFQIFESFPYAISIFDEDQDGDLDCVRAKRTQFDKDAPSVTYVWLIKGHNPRNITFHVKPGPTPDTSSYTMDEDYDHEYIAHFFYSDFKSCVIHDFPHKDKEECMMWVSVEAVDNIPQICTDKYLENCDVQIMVYDKDSCGEFMDVYVLVAPPLISSGLEAQRALVQRAPAAAVANGIPE